MESVTLEIVFAGELLPLMRAEDKLLPGLLELAGRWVVWVVPGVKKDFSLGYRVHEVFHCLMLPGFHGGFSKGTIHCPVDNWPDTFLM
eukprot:4707913-Ditylum_brightwellii.AAC.1